MRPTIVMVGEEVTFPTATTKRHMMVSARATNVTVAELSVLSEYATAQCR